MFSIYILVVYVALVALRPTRRVALALMHTPAPLVVPVFRPVMPL